MDTAVRRGRALNLISEALIPGCHLCMSAGSHDGGAVHDSLFLSKKAKNTKLPLKKKEEENELKIEELSRKAD